MTATEVEVSPPMEICGWPVHAWMVSVQVSPSNPVGYIIFVRVGNVIQSHPLHLWREMVDRFYLPMDLYNLREPDAAGRSLILEVECQYGAVCAAWVQRAEVTEENPLGWLAFVQVNDHIEMFPLHEFRALLDFIVKLTP